MKAEPIRLRLVGTKRLIMHCGRLADPLHPISKDLARLTGKRAKTEADHEEIGRVEWNGGLWLDGGKPAVPAEALMATFVEAARLRRRTMQAEAGLVVYHNAALIYDGPDDMDQLWEDERFRFRAGVVVHGNRTMRTRPVFNDWALEFTAHYLPTLLDRDQIHEIYANAGFTRGLGDWRPQNGTLEVEMID